MNRLVFNSEKWKAAGGDVGDNSQFFEKCEILATYKDADEYLAVVKWPDGRVTRGHLVSAMRPCTNI